jgi:acyl-CoA synthetase (AMP-forming)/AMP-acid ligase II
MAGYWRRPDLTAAVTRDGWLGTGDLAVADADGYFTVVGRAKDVIISGGENIYPAQVENAIGTHEAVLESAVIGVPDPFWGESVKAFVVLRRGRKASEEDIRDAVRSALGSYQKPREVEFVSTLPKTSAGKVAKHELRAAEPAGRA